MLIKYLKIETVSIFSSNSFWRLLLLFNLKELKITVETLKSCRMATKSFIHLRHRRILHVLHFLDKGQTSVSFQYNRINFL